MQKQNKQAQAAVRIGAALVLGALLMLKVLFSTSVNLINAGGITLERVNIWSRFSTRSAYTAAIDLIASDRFTCGYRQSPVSRLTGISFLASHLPPQLRIIFERIGRSGPPHGIGLTAALSVTLHGDPLKRRRLSPRLIKRGAGGPIGSPGGHPHRILQELRSDFICCMGPHDPDAPSIAHGSAVEEERRYGLG